MITFECFVKKLRTFLSFFSYFLVRSSTCLAHNQFAVCLLLRLRFMIIWRRSYIVHKIVLSAWSSVFSIVVRQILTHGGSCCYAPERSKTLRNGFSSPVHQNALAPLSLPFIVMIQVSIASTLLELFKMLKTTDVLYSHTLNPNNRIKSKERKSFTQRPQLIYSQNHRPPSVQWILFVVKATSYLAIDYINFQ